MLQLPPHGFDQRFDQRPAPSSIDRLAVQFWKNKLLLLAMGLSAILLLADRNSKALAEARPSLSHSLSNPLPRRPSREPEQLSAAPKIWVNPQIGSDSKADGSEQAPFRSLTRALQAARPQTLIQLAAGTYSVESGEQFPIVLKSNVTVQGNPDDLGQAIVIRGSGSYSSQSAGRQNVTIVGANQSILTGVTVTNPTVKGYGLWVEAGSPTIQSNIFTGSNVGLIAVGSSRPLVKSNLFMLNRSGLQMTGEAQPQVQDNIFQRTGTGITVGGTAAGQIVGNRISQNRDGIVVQDQARPTLRRNQIEDSERDGLIVAAQAQPDLGNRRQPGQNQFLNSRQHDVNASTAQTLSAVGNQITGRLTGKLDLTGQAELITSAPVSAPVRAPVSTPASAPVSTPASTPASTRIATPTRTELIASLPPVANKTAASTRSAVRPAYQTVAFSTPSAPAQTNLPVNTSVNISVPPPERVAALAGLQPASVQSIRALPARSTNPTAPTASRPVSVPAPVAQAAPQATPQATPAQTQPLNNVIVTAAASLPRQNFASLSAPTLSGSPINQPAPPAEPSSQPSPFNSPQPKIPPAPNSALLPVPAGEIPVGNTGDMARVSFGQTNAGQTGGAGSQSQSSPSQSQYRVLVADTGDQVQTLVQELAPDAFSTSVQGQSALQIGAFSSYANAQEAVQILSRNGLRGIIQPIE